MKKIKMNNTKQVSLIYQILKEVDGGKSKDIQILIANIIKININNHDNYVWFLKLIGIIMRNNIPEIKENILMKQSYEIKVITNYILNLNKFFNFIQETKYIIEPLIIIYIEKICNLLINENNFDEFYYLIDNKLNHIISILCSENYKNIKSEISLKISLKINKYIKKIKGNYNEIYKVIKIIISLKEYNLIEPHILLLLNNQKIYDNILPFINNNINDVKLISKLILLLDNLKEKDLFITQYHNQLIKRILSNKFNINNENIILISMITIFGEKETKKLFKCINDYDITIKTLLKFINMPNQINIPAQINMITTSYDAWNIDYNNGYIDNNNEFIANNNTELLNFFNTYNQFYKSEVNNKKKIVWLVHFGEIEIEYNNYQIKLFPIQLLILELFNSVQSYSIDEIKNNKLFKNYQSEYLDNIIKSLEICGILKNINNILQLSDTVFETDLIKVYYNCINNLVKIENNNILTELAHNRREIICTLINHLLKKGNKNLIELFNSINHKIKLFELNYELLNNAIEYMINQDYICKVNDLYEKIYY